MEPWIDSKDRRLLYELDLNCRRPLSRIAKRARMSTEVANYRLRKLEKAGAITQYQLVVDLSKLGVIPFKLMLSFQHMDSKRLQGAVDSLRASRSIMWIASCKGSWDLMVGAEEKSIAGVERLKDEIEAQFANHIDRKGFSISVGVEVYNRDYLIAGKEDMDRTRTAMTGAGPAKLDALDRRVLEQLEVNARRRIIDMASGLGVSERIVDYRIRRLVKDGVITGSRIALDYDALGIHFYKAFVYLDNPDPKRVGSLINYFRRNRNVIHNVRVMGNWDLEPEFETYSEEEFDSIMTEMQDAFSDIIKSVDVVTISKEHKFVYF